MDLAMLRAQFPVLERLAYLNAGSVGPAARSAVGAAEVDMQRQLEEGRGARVQFDHAAEQGDRLRARVAALLGADPWELALTGATTDGVNAVLAGLDLEPGDEILTSDEEHPGILAPLGLVVERRGVKVRTAPFDAIADHVGPQTRLIACSHVSWISGRVVDGEALATAPVPVLLDGAQAAGAIPVDVHELGCEYYAASGQKWLCGPVGSGYLYVREDAIEALSPMSPSYGTLADPLRALELPLVPGAARFDGGFPVTHQTAWALGALDVLENAGIDAVQARAAELAATLTERLAERGVAVAERGPSTLVSWEAADPQAEVGRLLDAGLLVRNLPGTPYVRASVGGWTSDEEIERLVAAVTSTS
ncbi:MAG TPA: aminotransferase class V-fold PLP-dependent enzyme [Thermoleophilaceae bacterium]|nr:aminotransferase class V-fold PLP-dependent enzyme [Thermoleophilaceae bacterium]